MRKVNIQKLFDTHGVPYVSQGKNVKKGHINVACPFCGDDPSFHLGINTDTLAWSCWRNSSHRGNYPHKLVKKLLNWSWPRVQEMFGQELVQDLSDFEKMAKSLWYSESESDTKTGVDFLEFPSNFKDISPSGSVKKFFDYLKSRGFSENEVKEVCEYYGLKCCLVGNWKDRIIIPVYQDGKLVSWTGRSFYKDSFLRYKSLEVLLSVVNIKHTIYNLDNVLSDTGNIVFIVEGPLDVLKLDYHLIGSENRAVGLFNMSPTVEQLSVLYQLKGRFKKFVVLLDSGELFSSMNLLRNLAFLGNVELGSLPKGVKDPGDLTKDMIYEYYR